MEIRPGWPEVTEGRTASRGWEFFTQKMASPIRKPQRTGAFFKAYAIKK
jgi:hypothetical protein